MLFGRRGCSFAPQRLQRGCSFPSARFNWWHSPQTRMPAFASVVVLTMLAAVTFDPRLIWDNTNLDDENE